MEDDHISVKVNVVPANSGFNMLTPVLDFEDNLAVTGIETEPILAWRVETNASNLGGLASSVYPVCQQWTDNPHETYAIEAPDGTIRPALPGCLKSRTELLAWWQEDRIGFFAQKRANYAKHLAETKASQPNNEPKKIPIDTDEPGAYGYAPPRDSRLRR